MRIIPAIDLMKGGCVRLLRGDFNAVSKYEGAPEKVASEFVSSGLPRVHIVDLEGARSGRIVQWTTLAAILSVSGLSAQVGGGVRNEEDIERLLSLGAKQVVLGSIAMRSPETVRVWASKFGAEHFCIAADLQDGALASAGWTKKEITTLDEVVSKLESFGILDFLCTDISKDGTLEGPNFDLYRTLVRDHTGIRWIASGGISSLQDLEILKQIGLSGAVLGKAIYEGKIQLEELVQFSRLPC